LEAITHPLVRERARALETAAPDGSVVVHDVPLLVERGQAGRFDAVIVVDADDETQVRRLAEARGMDPADARARIAAQASREQRRAAADYVIVNGGSLDDLRAQVDAVWAAITSA
jgi:dephospho-CoA kinase